MDTSLWLFMLDQADSSLTDALLLLIVYARTRGRTIESVHHPNWTQHQSSAELCMIVVCTGTSGTGHGEYLAYLTTERAGNMSAVCLLHLCLTHNHAIMLGDPDVHFVTPSMSARTLRNITAI